MLLTECVYMHVCLTDVMYICPKFITIITLTIILQGCRHQGVLGGGIIVKYYYSMCIDPRVMSIQYRNGKLTAHFTLEMLSDGIYEHQTFKIFLGEHSPRPPRCRVPMPPE